MYRLFLVTTILLVCWVNSSKIADILPSPCDGLLEPSVLSVDKPLEDIRANRGESLTLSCSFYGAPQPSIIWYHKGKRVDNHPGAYYETLLNANQLGQSVVESVLRIDCLDEKTVGEYFCEAKSPCTEPVVSAANVFLSNDPSPLPKGSCKSQRRSTQTPPIISAFTVSRIELPSRVTQLMCRVGGNPLPKTRWMKIEEDESLSSISGLANYMHLSNGDLLIVGDEDTITESFRCIAENPLGSVHQDATVVYMSP